MKNLKKVWVYYPDRDGGFIGSIDGQTQICDFRQGMGERFGKQIANALNSLEMVLRKEP